MSKTGDKMIDVANEAKPAPKRRRVRKKAEPKPQGLGDVVEKVTKATGIDKVVKAVAGDDCGCDERKKKLNEAFPILANKRMDDRQKAIYETVVVPAISRSTQIDRKTMVAIRQMWGELGMGKLKVTGCPGCARKMLSKLKSIYEASCEES